MNETLFHPEIHRSNWLPPLSMATALHLLLLMAALYAPGFPRFRHEVKEVVHLVNILDQVEPGKVQIAAPPRPAPTKQLARQTSPVASPAKPKAIPSSRPNQTDPPPTVSEQPQPVSEYSVYGQDSNPPPARQLGKKTGATGQGIPETVTGKAGPASVIPDGAGTDDRESTRKRYLAGISAHIEAHKFYPPAARRRRLEGTVQVSFTLEAGGKISDLQVSEGGPILEQAAREAVERSLPLPAPKGAASTPLPISYRMNFQLR